MDHTETAMLIPDDIAEATRRAIALHLPFVLYMTPGSLTPVFFASDRDDDNQIDIDDPEGVAFVIDTFALNIQQRSDKTVIAVRPELTAADVLAMPEDTPAFDEAEIHTVGESTQFMHYYANVVEMKNAMKKRRVKKCVMSRRLTLSLAGNDIVQTAERYFASLPDTFRALYFTQETGLWITATPEHLLIYKSDEDAYMSMALAGTRRIGSNGDWDEKNNQEHDVVVDYIRNRMECVTSDVTVEEHAPLRFGDIEHLCHIIRCKARVEPSVVLSLLNPTPAVAGYPLIGALKLIQELEPHHRHCYGGFIGLKKKRDLDLYVNLRCAHIEPKLSTIEGEEYTRYNLYGGGGIMPASDPTSEWREAGRKMMPLYEAAYAGTDKEKNRIMPTAASPCDVPAEWMSSQPV